MPYPILTILILFPILAGVGVFFIRKDRTVRIYTLGIFILQVVLALPLLRFDTSGTAFQFVDRISWVPAWGLEYHVGVDGISVLMVGLALILSPLCVLCSWSAIKIRVRSFHFALLLLSGACVGVFSALDFLLFYFFWEAVLIPMYLIIAIWGGSDRDHASLRFILYTLAGSVLLLVAVIAFGIGCGTFSIPELMTRHFSLPFQRWTFLVMALAFAVKVPMFPFHTWLPGAYSQAPTAGSILLSCVLAKMGAYGFLRFALPLTPDASVTFAPLMIALSIASILYGGLMALGQSHIKKLIAYASVAHMGFVTLGIFLFNSQGTQGAVLQMVNHGVTSGMLFMLAGILHARTHSYELSHNMGLGKIIPAFMGFWGLAAFSGFAFPGTNTFVGEFLIFTGAFKRSLWIGFLMVPGALIAAAYCLRITQHMAWGGANPVEKLRDLMIREWACLLPMALLIIYMGLAPGKCLEIIDRPVKQTLEHIRHSSSPQTSFFSRRDAETLRKSYINAFYASDHTSIHGTLTELQQTKDPGSFRNTRCASASLRDIILSPLEIGSHQSEGRTP